MLSCMIALPPKLTEILEDVDWRKEFIEAYASKDEALRQINEIQATIKEIEEDIRTARSIADENPDNADFQEFAFDDIEFATGHLRSLQDRLAFLQRSIKVFDDFIAAFHPLVRKDDKHR